MTEIHLHQFNVKVNQQSLTISPGLVFIKYCSPSYALTAPPAGYFCPYSSTCLFYSPVCTHYPWQSREETAESSSSSSPCCSCLPPSFSPLTLLDLGHLTLQTSVSCSNIPSLFLLPWLLVIKDVKDRQNNHLNSTASNQRIKMFLKKSVQKEMT